MNTTKNVCILMMLFVCCVSVVSIVVFPLIVRFDKLVCDNAEDSHLISASCFQQFR